MTARSFWDEDPNRFKVVLTITRGPDGSIRVETGWTEIDPYFANPTNVSSLFEWEHAVWDSLKAGKPLIIKWFIDHVDDGGDGETYITLYRVDGGKWIQYEEDGDDDESLDEEIASLVKFLLQIGESLHNTLWRLLSYMSSEEDLATTLEKSAGTTAVVLLANLPTEERELSLTGCYLEILDWRESVISTSKGDGAWLCVQVKMPFDPGGLFAKLATQEFVARARRAWEASGMRFLVRLDSALERLEIAILGCRATLQSQIEASD